MSSFGSDGKAGKPRRVRRLDPYRPFPIDALPEPIRSYVICQSRAIGCDPAFVAVPAISAAAGMIGNSRCIRLKPGWKEPMVLWTMVISESGTHKTPAWESVFEPIHRMQQQRFRAHDQALEDFRAAAGRGEDAGKEPVCERLICSDITIEKVTTLQSQNPRGLLLPRDELGGWLGSFARYKGRSGGSDMPNWLSMHSAGPVLVDRKGGDHPVISVPRAALSIAGGIQPGVLARAMSPEFLDAGLLARFLMAMPKRLDADWTEEVVEEKVWSAYVNCMRVLRALECDKQDGQLAPFVVKFNRDAKALWIDFYREWKKLQIQSEGDMATALSKLEAYAARLALFHHTVSRSAAGDDRNDLEPESMESGVTLARWFANEARRVYSILTEKEDDRVLRRLHEEVERRGGKITCRELQRSNQRRYPEVSDAKEALACLVDMGLAEWTDLNEGGRKPSPGIALVVTADDPDADPTADPSAPSAESLAADWYRLWDPGTLVTPGTRDLVVTAELLKLHGAEAAAVLRCLVSIVRKEWPACRTLTGAVSYLPEATKAHQAETRREMAREVSIVRAGESQLESVERQERDRDRLARWNALPAPHQEAIRRSVLGRPGASAAPEAFLRRLCLEEVERLNGSLEASK